MKKQVYFQHKRAKVTDYPNPKFAKYQVTADKILTFDDLDAAILVCMALGEGKSTQLQAITYADTFLTMIRTKK